MTPSPNSPSSDTWRDQPWVVWLHQNGLALPAWIVAESMRPMAWVAGQIAVVAHPLVNGLGVGGWHRLIEVLEDPAAYDSLCTALQPNEDTPA